MRGYLAEGYRWLDAPLAAAPERTDPRARALLAACLMGLRRGVHERIHEFGAESVAIFAELGDHAGMFDAVEVSTAYRTIVSSEKEIEALLGRARGAGRRTSSPPQASGLGGPHARYRGLLPAGVSACPGADSRLRWSAARS